MNILELLILIVCCAIIFLFFIFNEIHTVKQIRDNIIKLEKQLDYLEFRNSINTDNDESIAEGDDSYGDDDN